MFGATSLRDDEPGFRTPAVTGLHRHAEAVAYAGAALLAVAMIASPWTGHVDDTDGHLYRVVVRHMVADATWTDLRYLPGVHPAFREHLPFGLWPMAAAVRLFGEGALPFVGAAWTLGTVLITGLTARRLFGSAAGVFAMVVLALTESLTVLGGRPLLDPPLLFLSTLAMAPVLTRPVGWKTAVWSAGWGALAALVKGPFGLVAPAAAWTARLFFPGGSRARVLFWGALAGVGCALPVTVFLLADRANGGSYWTGYVEHQLLASASGARTDGSTAWWFPFRTLGGRFWPGLLFAGAGFGLALCRTGWLARRGLSEEEIRSLRQVAVTAALILAFLCLPSRKVWNHALVAYPALALLGAGAFALLLRARVFTARTRAVAAVAVLTAGVAAMALAAAGAGRVFLRAPCVSGEVAMALSQLPEGEPVAVVSGQPIWMLVGALAAEHQLEPWPSASTAQLPPAVFQRVRWALAAADGEVAGEGWRQVASDGRLKLYRRE